MNYDSVASTLTNWSHQPKAMFERKPWFKFGDVVGSFGNIAGGVKSVKELIEHAGLNEEVVKLPLYLPDGTEAIGWNTVLKDHNIPIGLVGKDYKVVQNTDAFRAMEEILGTGLVELNSVFPVGKGEKIIVSARIKNGPQVTGDEREKYLIMYNSHDGSSIMSYMTSIVQLFCLNTLLHATKQASDKFKIRHSGDVDQKLFEAKKFMAEIIQGFEVFDEKIVELSKKPFSDEQFKMLMGLLENPSAKALKSGKVEDNSTRKVNIWEAMEQYWHKGKGMAHPTKDHTAYGAITAIAEYADYGRGVRVTERNTTQQAANAEAVLLGSAARMKRESMNLVEVILEHTEKVNEKTEKDATIDRIFKLVA